MAGEAYAVAVDLGGTKVEAAIVSSIGSLVDASRFRAPTGPGLTGRALAESLAVLVSRTLEHLPPGADLAGIGVGSAGPVNLAGGAVSPINLPDVVDFPLVEILRAAAPGTDVALRLDGSCIALAEAAWGATRGQANSISLVVSTGIGSGIIAGGALVTGKTGNAGHLGQVRVGAGGTLEEVAAGPASVRWAREQGWSGRTGEDLARACAAGDGVALAAVARSAEAMAEAITDAVTLLDSSVVAIGGGFSRVTPDYVDMIGAGVHRLALHAYVRSVRVLRSGLGDTAPLLGAAALALLPDLR